MFNIRASAAASGSGMKGVLRMSRSVSIERFTPLIVSKTSTPLT